MGRSGGRSGGSRSSGGRSGGSRSSGGRSSSSGRSSRSSSSSSSSSIRINTRSSSTTHHHYGGGHSSRGSSSSSPPTLMGCFTLVGIVVVMIFLWAMVYVLIEDSKITKSSTNRVPVEFGLVNETEYYTDELAWIRHSSELTEGMKEFYRETGVQPYLYITDNIYGKNRVTVDELTKYAETLYGQLFTDEAHFLLVFHEYDEEYTMAFVVGKVAKPTIDWEATEIILDYVEHYYYQDSLSEEEMFSKAFNDSAERLMKVTPSMLPGVIFIALVIFVACVIVKQHNRKQQLKLEEARRTQEILSTPLEKLATSEVESLASKYEDEEE